MGRLLQALKGNLFMTTPFPPGTYTRADCARWLAGDPGTRSCVTAMLADHAFDYLLQAAACGLLGLAGLAAYLVLRHRWNDRATVTALPAGTAQGLGAILAAIAAVACLGLGGRPRNGAARRRCGRAAEPGHRRRRGGGGVRVRAVALPAGGAAAQRVTAPGAVRHSEAAQKCGTAP